MKTLGVLIDLDPEGSNGDLVTVGHTDSRVAELQQSLDEFLKEKKMSRKDAEKLRGRLQWFESFAQGRIAQQALRVIGRIASSGRQKETLTGFELNAIAFLRERVLGAPPTQIQSTNLSTWLIFRTAPAKAKNRSRAP